MGWKEELERTVSGKKVVVLGVGNELKGDDALGKHVFDLLRTEDKIFCATMPENFIRTIREKGPEIILIVDAVDFGERAGSIVFAEARSADQKSISTHSLSFMMLSKMVPDAQLFLLGVQPESLEFGKPMGDTVRRSGDEIAVALDLLLAAK